MLSSGQTPARMYPYIASLKPMHDHVHYMELRSIEQTECASIPIISYIQYPGIYNGGRGGGGVRVRVRVKVRVRDGVRGRDPLTITPSKDLEHPRE